MIKIITFNNKMLTTCGPYFQQNRKNDIMASENFQALSNEGELYAYEIFQFYTSTLANKIQACVYQNIYITMFTELLFHFKIIQRIHQWGYATF